MVENSGQGKPRDRDKQAEHESEHKALLQDLARIYRDRLSDPARAEAAFRLVAADQDPTGWTDCNADISSAVDFSIMAGAGVKIGKGLRGFTFEVTYDYGLSNIIKDDTGTSGKNRNLMFSFGYIVPII